MVVRFWMIVRALGDLTAILSFCILMMFAWLALEALRNPDAELFPAPLRYLDAKVTGMGELYYVPDSAAYCPGDRVTWTSNAYNLRSTAVSVSYYLQSEHPYSFSGPQARLLDGKYPGPKVEVVSLYQDINTTAFHTREGTYIGGSRSFTIPPQSDMLNAETLAPGATLRLYVELDAPFSRGAGYFIEWKQAQDCHEVTP